MDEAKHPAMLPALRQLPNTPRAVCTLSHMVSMRIVCPRIDFPMSQYMPCQLQVVSVLIRDGGRRSTSCAIRPRSREPRVLQGEHDTRPGASTRGMQTTPNRNKTCARNDKTDASADQNCSFRMPQAGRCGRPGGCGDGAVRAWSSMCSAAQATNRPPITCLGPLWTLHVAVGE